MSPTPLRREYLLPEIPAQRLGFPSTDVGDFGVLSSESLVQLLMLVFT